MINLILSISTKCMKDLMRIVVLSALVLLMALFIVVPDSASASSGVSNQAVIRNDAGGSLTLLTTYGTVATIDCPTDWVDVNARVILEASKLDELGLSVPSSTGYKAVDGLIFKITAVDNDKGTTISKFNKNINLTFGYSDKVITESGVNEMTMAIFYWDESTGKWTKLDSKINGATNSLKASINHFTVFAVMGVVEGKNPSFGNFLNVEQNDLTSVPTRISNPNLNFEEQAINYFVQLFGHTPKNDEWKVVHFIAYGTTESKRMSLRDRKGVIGDYYETYHRIPLNNSDWSDIASILTSKKPNQKSQSAEDQAISAFHKIFERVPNVNLNQDDEFTLNFMAYKLRSVNRNLELEKGAIRKFQSIYKFIPSSSSDWSIVRALAYTASTK